MLYFRRADAHMQYNTGISMLQLVHDGLGFPEYSTTELYPSFRMDTYASLSKEQKRDAGDSILQHVNDFLKIFSDDEQKYIYQYFVLARRAIARMEAAPNAVRIITDDLTAMTITLMTQLQFCERALALIETTVKLPDLEYVGKATHFSDKFSFYDTDYYHLTAVSLLCKFMSPIWGEFISAVGQNYIDPSTQKPAILLDERNNKELFCATMIVPVLETGTLSFIYNKLHLYMRNIIDKCIKDLEKTSGNKSQPPIDFVMARYGYDDKRFEDYVYSMLLVKRIVGFDPWQVTDGKRANIVIYTNTAINRTTGAQLKRMRNETRTMTRNDVPEGGSEPENISYTDNLSRISLVTADVPLCVVFGVQQQISRLCAAEEIPPALYRQAVDYYIYSRVDTSLFNNAIMASLHARWIGGSAMLRYLDATTHVHLLAFTQLFLIKHDYPQLAVFLTCRTRPTLLTHVRPEGQRIGNSTKNTSEYKRVGDMYPGSAEKDIIPFGQIPGTRAKKHLVEIVNVAGQIDKLQKWTIEYDHIADIAPCVKELLPEPWKENVTTGEVLVYNENIIQNMCSFFLAQHNYTQNSS